MELEKLYSLYVISSGVVTDTRKIKAGNIFFALKGERFNGNEFAKKALDAGASYVVIDEEDKKQGEKFILVKNVLKTMQELARYHRRQMNIPVLAITGTNGKTTTKELVHAVLSSTYKTHCTEGNLNNQIGVPLTLLRMPLDTEIAVIEMGANHQKEIDFLCQIAEPSHGLVTNVGKAHLEGFGSFECIIETKSELYKYLAKFEGVAFVNKEEKYLLDMAKPCSQQEIYTREKYYLDIKGNSPFLEITLDDFLVRTQLIGKYNFPNILTAVAIGQYFKVKKEKIIHSLSHYTPKNNRSQWIQKGSNAIILDAYNANPTSMKVAITNFASINSPNKIAILGDMLELGKESDKEHLEIINQLHEMGIDFITIGKAFMKVNQKNAHESIMSLESQWDWGEYSETVFLLKGSRGVQIERLLKA